MSNDLNNQSHDEMDTAPMPRGPVLSLRQHLAQRRAAEELRQADEAVVPHPLRGREPAWLDDYARCQLMLRGEGKTLDENKTLLRPFAIALGIPLPRFEKLRQEVAGYGDQEKCDLFDRLPDMLAWTEEVSCFMCDMVRQHGEKYQLEGEFLALWRDVAIGVFQLSGERLESLERLASRIASGGELKPDEKFGELPLVFVQYYLAPQQVAGQYRVKGTGQYMVIDLSGGCTASQYPVRYTGDAPNLLENDCRMTELWLRRIDAGSFMMGSPLSELGRIDGEFQHRVTLTQDYYIGIFPCTQRQYELVTGSNPSNFKGGDLPVEQVSHTDSASFLELLRKKTGLEAFDLPTEAEWEYACRADTTTALNSGRDIMTTDGKCPNLDAVAWYDKNSGGSTNPVGQKHPNAWGLYDMHGNVLEWCRDWYGRYAATEATDPDGAQSGGYRVYRGGSWNSAAQFCRAAYRNGGTPSDAFNYFGFRIVFRPTDVHGSKTLTSQAKNVARIAQMMVAYLP